MNLERLIELYRTSLAVDVYGLVKALDLSVVERELEEDVSGVIEPFESSFRITLNRHDHSFRKRFTLAHELGHWLYHSHLIGSGLGDNRLYHSSNIERFYNSSIHRRHENQANAFAAWLLIPANKLESDLKGFRGNPDWSYLSERYQISSAALKKKSRQLQRTSTRERMIQAYQK